MPYPTPQNDVQINRVHTGAVCKEMGERLSVALGPQSIELQPCLLSLMKQLSELPTCSARGAQRRSRPRSM